MNDTPLDALRAIFAETWIDDGRRLTQAMRASDARVVLQTLHRVKGALLVLGEREAAACCDGLRELVQTQGVSAATVARLREFQERVGTIAASGVPEEPQRFPR